MRKVLSIMMVACIVFASLPLTTVFAAKETKDSDMDYTESTEMIPNPFMGYPNKGYAANGGFLMLEDGTSKIHTTGDHPGGFTWYYIDLKAFSKGNDGGRDGVAPNVVGGVDKEISVAALNAFEQTLTTLRLNGGSVLLRFVYDTNGVPGCEPEDFNMIITHIEQLCEVVSRFPDVVQGFECGIVGVYGEMHFSKYVDKEYVNQIMDAYLDNTPDSMVLLMRTPSRIADYLGMTAAELASYVPEEGSKAYRLGYYNDGYMNSDSDLGTWSYNRALETNYLAQGNTPYGGEYGGEHSWIIESNSSVHLPENALPEMYKTHVSFIRGNVYNRDKSNGSKNSYFGYDDYPFDPAYLDSLPNAPDTSAFLGSDCFDFIVAHLGYRLVLRESRLSISPKAGETLVLQGKIENTGFAHVLHNPKAEVLLIKDGAAYICDVNLDANNLKSCTVYDYNFELSLPSNLAGGDYDVYLRLSHVDESFYAAAKSGIRFANNGGIYYEKLGANKLGSVTVTAAEKPGSAANDVFAQINNPNAGAAIHQGAPLLLAHGYNASGSINLNLLAGESITLSSVDFLRSDSYHTCEWVKDGMFFSAKKEPTITAQGTYQVFINGNEAQSMSVVVSESACSFGEWTTITQATCSSVGTAERVCSDCGLKETKYLPTLNHIASTQTRTTEPTCTKLGRVVTPCALCGETLSFTLRNLPKLPHTLGAYAIVKAPSCTEEGLLSRTCSDCDYTETKPMSTQHSYDITIKGTTVSGTCTLCNDVFGPKDFSNTLPSGDTLNSQTVKIGNDPLVLVGPGGFVENYRSKTDERFITFLFRMTGVEEEIRLAKFRTLSFTKELYNINSDSNDNDNYFGECAYPVTHDGIWGLTISAKIMALGNSIYFGGVNWAAFNDPLSTKGTADFVNNNTNAAMQLLGIYDGLLSYDIIFVDEQNNFLETHSGSYDIVTNNVWKNWISNVLTAEEMYQGIIPSKPSDANYSYTFAGWVDADGNPIDAVISNVIAYPSFTAISLLKINKNFDVLYVCRNGKISAEGAIKYESSDPSVATIDEKSGAISGKKPGTTVITVTTAEGEGSISITVKYTWWQRIWAFFLSWFS